MPVFFSSRAVNLIYRQACKSFNYASHAKTISPESSQPDIYSLGLPVPDYCRPLGILPGLQRDILTTHAVRLNQGLELGRAPQLFPLHDSGSITWTRVVFGRWLLVAVSDRTSSVLKLWPLSAFTNSAQPTTPHTLAYLDGPVCSGCVETQNGEIVVIFELATVTYVLNRVPS